MANPIQSYELQIRISADLDPATEKLTGLVEALTALGVISGKSSAKVKDAAGQSRAAMAALSAASRQSSGELDRNQQSSETSAKALQQLYKGAAEAGKQQTAFHIAVKGLDDELLTKFAPVLDSLAQKQQIFADAIGHTGSASELFTKGAEGIAGALAHTTGAFNLARAAQLEWSQRMGVSRQVVRDGTAAQFEMAQKLGALANASVGMTVTTKELSAAFSGLSREQKEAIATATGFPTVFREILGAFGVSTGAIEELAKASPKLSEALKQRVFATDAAAAAAKSLAAEDKNSIEISKQLAAQALQSNKALVSAEEQAITQRAALLRSDIQSRLSGQVDLGKQLAAQARDTNRSLVSAEEEGIKTRSALLRADIQGRLQSVSEATRSIAQQLGQLGSGGSALPALKPDNALIERAAQVQRDFAAAFDATSLSGKGAGAVITKFREAVAETSPEILKQIVNAKDHYDRLRILGKEFGLTGDALTLFSSKSKDSETRQSQHKISTAALSAATKQLRGEVTSASATHSDFLRVLGRGTVALGSHTGALLGAGRGFNQFGQLITSGAADFSSSLGPVAIAVGALGAASLATVASIKKLLEAGAEVSKAFDAIAVRAPVERIAELKTAIFDLSSTTGIAFGELADGMGRALLKTGQDVSAAKSLLETAAGTSLAAVTSTASAVENLGDVVRSYKLKIEDVKDVSNALIALSRESGESFDQTAKGVAQLQSGMESFGVEGLDAVQRVSQALAEVVRNGRTAESATFALNAILGKLSSPTSDLSKQLESLGFDTTKAANSQRGLIETLKQADAVLRTDGRHLRDYLENARYLPALNILLGSSTQRAADAMAAMQSKADLAKKALADLDQPGRRFRNLINEIQTVVLELGDSFIQVFGGAFLQATLALREFLVEFRVLKGLTSEVSGVLVLLNPVIGIAALTLTHLDFVIRGLRVSLATAAVTFIEFQNLIGALSDEEASTAVKKISDAFRQTDESIKEAQAREVEFQKKLEAFRNAANGAAGAAAELGEKAKASAQGIGSVSVAAAAAAGVAKAAAEELKSVTQGSANQLAFHVAALDTRGIKADLRDLSDFVGEAGDEIQGVFDRLGREDLFKRIEDKLSKAPSLAGGVSRAVELLKEVPRRGLEALSSVVSNSYGDAVDKQIEATKRFITIGNAWARVLDAVGVSSARLRVQIQQGKERQDQANETALLQRQISDQVRVATDSLSDQFKLAGDSARLFKNEISSSINEYLKLAILARRPIDTSGGLGTGQGSKALRSAQELLDQQQKIDASWARIRGSALSFDETQRTALQNAEEDLRRVNEQMAVLAGLAIAIGADFSGALEYMKRSAAAFSENVIEPLSSFGGAFDKEFLDFFRRFGDAAAHGAEGAQNFTQTIQDVQGELEQFGTQKLGTFEAMDLNLLRLATTLDLLSSKIAEFGASSEESERAQVAGLERSRDAVEGLIESYRHLREERRTGFGEGFSTGIKKFIEDAQDGFKLGQEAAQEFASGATSALTDFLTTLGRGGAGIKAFGQAMLQTIQQIIARIIALQIVSGFLGLIGGPTSLLASLGLVPGLATGGPVKKSEPYLVGEGGPELFVPDQPGKIIPFPRTHLVLGQAVQSVRRAFSAPAQRGQARPPQELQAVGAQAPLEVFARAAPVAGQAIQLRQAPRAANPIRLAPEPSVPIRAARSLAGFFSSVLLGQRPAQAGEARAAAASRPSLARELVEFFGASRLAVPSLGRPSATSAPAIQANSLISQFPGPVAAGRQGQAGQAGQRGADGRQGQGSRVVERFIERRIEAPKTLVQALSTVQPRGVGGVATGQQRTFSNPLLPAFSATPRPFTPISGNQLSGPPQPNQALQAQRTRTSISSEVAKPQPLSRFLQRSEAPGRLAAGGRGEAETLPGRYKVQGSELERRPGLGPRQVFSSPEASRFVQAASKIAASLTLAFAPLALSGQSRAAGAQLQSRPISAQARAAERQIPGILRALTQAGPSFPGRVELPSGRRAPPLRGSPATSQETPQAGDRRRQGLFGGLSRVLSEITRQTEGLVIQIPKVAVEVFSGRDKAKEKDRKDGGSLASIKGLGVVRALAQGGIVSAPQIFQVAEAGRPEAVVPLPGPGRGIPVEFRKPPVQQGQPQKHVAVTINLTVQSLDPRTAADVVLAQMPQISRALASVIDEGRDRGLGDAIRGVRR